MHQLLCTIANLSRFENKFVAYNYTHCFVSTNCFDTKQMSICKMASQLLSCPYCTCKDFKTQEGLTQHQQNSTKSRDLLRQKCGIRHTASYPHDNIRIQHLIPTQGKSDLLAASETIVRLHFTNKRPREWHRAGRIYFGCI